MRPSLPLPLGQEAALQRTLNIKHVFFPRLGGRVTRPAVGRSFVSLPSNDAAFPEGKACRVGFRVRVARSDPALCPWLHDGGPGFPLFMPGGLLHGVTVKWEGAGRLVRMLPGT